MNAHVLLAKPIVAAALCLGLACGLLTACSDDDGDDGGSGTPAATSEARTPPASAATQDPVSSATPGDAAQEVVGIVGAVNEAQSTIEITRLSGADVTTISVDGATLIVSPTGGALALGDLRPSDRIIARGAVDGDELAADRVDVQSAVPGAQPGG